MYETFYSLSANPFQLTPDSRFFFGSAEHKKAMAFLEYGLAQREGFVVVTGEIGSGKTTLIEYLLSTLDPDKHVVARVVTTQLGGYDTLCIIAEALGIADQAADKGRLIVRIQQLFSNLQCQGKHPLIIVDEAQSLTTEAIEELRMLSNLMTGPRAAFQGIFLGQPEFRLALAAPELYQLRQRVIASCHLGALNAEDTRRYIEHRLKRVGWNADPRFTDDSFEEIHGHSGGIPRRINSLCSRLLLFGFLEESHEIDASTVSRVALEMAAELGHVSRHPMPHRQHLEPGCNFDDSTGELRSRLSNVERVTRKHDKAIVRVLDLALRYLPPQDGKAK